MSAELDTLKNRLRILVVDELGMKFDGSPSGDSSAVEADKVRAMIMRQIQAQPTPLSAEDKAELCQDVYDDVVEYGPITKFLKDPEVTEVMVNGPDSIYVERFGRISTTQAGFLDDGQLRRVIDKILRHVGRRVDESNPMADARLPDGSRVNIVVPPLSLKGPAITIRKFSTDPMTIDDLIAFGTVPASVADFLRQCVEGKLNVIISGGTGSGKTTTLNVLSSFIPEDQRIITIEDTAELRLHQDHVLVLESRPPNIEGAGEVTIRDLVRNALRMRPDRIVVGEARGGEALDMLQAMYTGHDGSLSTVHANSPRDALARLETMVLMAGMDLPDRAIREQVSSAVDMIIHQARLSDGTRRIVQITEVQGMEDETVTMQDVFSFDFSMGVDDDRRHLGHLKPTGIRPQFTEKLKKYGIDMPPTVFEYEQGAQAVGW